MTINDIPAINASFNALSTVLICTGIILVRARQIDAHRRVMLAAGASSALFLVGYLAHKYLHGHTPFGGTGTIRTVYLTMLATHVFLAMMVAWMVPVTYWLALSGRIDRHRAWVKWTVPIWLYVSVTGVLVYFFLYQWWPVTDAVARVR